MQIYLPSISEILMAIKFHFLEPIKFNQRKKVKLLVNSLFEKEKKNLNSLDIIFCSDDYLLQINREFLSHDYFTDIITFDLSEIPSRIAGEIYISTDTAMANATRYKVLSFNEFLRLIIHGSLHLCGYGDKKKSDKVLMSTKENAYLSLFETL